MKYQLREYQRQASNAAVAFFLEKRSEDNALIVAATGCHAKGSEILMFDGTYKKVEDIRIGDKLVGNDGKKREVLMLHNGIDSIYKITPIKGRPFFVNGNHILSLYRTKRYSRESNQEPKYDEITVNEYIKTNEFYKHLHKLYKPDFVDFGNESKAVEEPYFLGLYLGDGSSVSSVGITTQRKEVEDFLYEFAEKHCIKIRKQIKKNCKASSYYFSNYKRSRSKKNYTSLLLDRLGLTGLTSGDKFIPIQYKTASKRDRLELLGGLLDTDAYYHEKRNSYEYCTKSRQLANDIDFLCKSLGFFCNIGKDKVVNGVSYYRMQISGDVDEIPTKVCIRKGKRRQQKKNHLVTGFSVEYIGEGEYYGFTIDGNHLYCDSQFFVHHNCGKSLIIADIAYRLDSDILVFCPTKEITQQNYAKMKTYDVECSMYSASVGQKVISKITFATIGSVKSCHELFSHFKYVIVDEAHYVNSEGGMYKDFFDNIDCKVLGLTATPYRLETEVEMNWKTRTITTASSSLVMLTDYKDAIFKDIIYNVDAGDLTRMGFLSKMKYYNIPPRGWDEEKLFKNTTGSDYSDSSVKFMQKKVNFGDYLVSVVRRLLNPKNGSKRNGILVFTRFIDEAEALANSVEGGAFISGQMTKKNRERILKEFEEGKIKVLANAGVLIVGYDRPDLDTVVLASPTLSLARYYQEIGRAIRLHPSKKEGWIVDVVGNFKRFGRVEELKLSKTEKDTWCITSNGRQLTD